MTSLRDRGAVRFRVLGLAVVASMALVGCATQADIADLEREQHRIRTQLADTRATVDGMQREIAKLRGKVEEVHYSTRGKGGSARLESLEARIALMEKGQSVEPVPQATGTDAGTDLVAPAPTPIPAATPPRGEVSASELAREAARELPPEYRKGLTLVGQGEYDRAIPAFREFMRTNPNAPLVPSAHYWIGEAYSALGDTQQAILNYYEVRKSPKNEHAPAAILKIGLAFLRMGNKSEAKLAFQKVVNDYPSSPEAVQAREKLQALGG